MKHTICLLNDSFPPIIDGVANTVANYARIIENAYGHCMVATPRVPGVKNKEYVKEFPVIRYPSIDTRKLIGYVTGYPFSPEVAHAVSKEGVELLHSHCPAVSTLLARQIAEAANLPLVMTWHTKFDIDIASAVRNKLLQEGAKQAFLHNVNACDEIWAVSRGAGENLRSLGYEGDYVVMPNGVDLPREAVSSAKISEVTGDYDLPHNTPCFLFVGRMRWYKGLRIILDALADLKREDIDYRMVFVGGGADEDEAKEYAHAVGVADKVFFTGPISERDDLRAWYSRADLFLFPSSYDTNGLVVREAAASDTASVIIRGSCAAEGVTDGRNGFFIDENAASLAAMLRELTANPDAVAKAGKAAGDEIYISWEDAVAGAYERYDIVIENYKRGVYGRHDPLKGSWMQSQGELMQVLGRIEAASKGLISGIETIQSEIDTGVRSVKDKAITELINAGHGAKENISEAARSIWEKLDRYL